MSEIKDIWKDFQINRNEIKPLKQENKEIKEETKNLSAMWVEKLEQTDEMQRQKNIVITGLNILNL